MKKYYTEDEIKNILYDSKDIDIVVTPFLSTLRGNRELLKYHVSIFGGTCELTYNYTFAKKYQNAIDCIESLGEMLRSDKEILDELMGLSPGEKLDEVLKYEIA